jgi:hypothetical protein
MPWGYYILLWGSMHSDSLCFLLVGAKKLEEKKVLELTETMKDCSRLLWNYELKSYMLDVSST